MKFILVLLLSTFAVSTRADSSLKETIEGQPWTFLTNQMSCMNLTGRFQEADSHYTIKQNDCSSVYFYVQRLLPPWGDKYGDYIADGNSHENELELGPYTAKIDQKGLTVVSSSGVFRYFVRSGDCKGNFPNSKYLLKETLDPVSGAVKKCVHLGF